ncbi:MAG: hypothetical protein HY907_20465, partial [Deltaproteobacteria bacterium]|nr:hypothetical protein [Deltaproteobacteria bacterium]
NLDDDCDGATDEGLTRPCGTDGGAAARGARACPGGGGGSSDGGSEPQPELCDLLDNDCDGSTDEGNPGGGADCYTGPAATRGVGVCEDGVTQCTRGTFVCSGETLPRTEDCNGLDDDCDGLTDESLPVGSCGTDEGECTAGTRECIAGAWACDGELGPTTEICDLLDNDCDAATDEGNPGGAVPCGWSPDPLAWDLGLCEPGIANCEVGTIVCTGVIGPAPEECNGLDDDCNGLIDDGLSLGEPCGLDEGACDPGRLQCVGGATECVGGTIPDLEICDCNDNDCDAETDEGDLCGGGAVCLDCSCAMPCDPHDEFPCPDPKVCECDLVPERPEDCFCVGSGVDCGGVRCAACQECVADVCVDTCPDCEACQAATGECTDVCEGVECTPGITECACVANEPSCEAINCYLPGRECPEGFRCEAAACVEDPCYTVSCPPGQFCRDGDCFDVCEAGVTCATDEICVDGTCVDDPCSGVVCVNPDDVCVDGYCPDDPGSPCETVECPWPQVCRDGLCVDDPCAYIECPAGSSCERGTCVELGGSDADADADGGTDGDAGADAGEDAPLDRTRVLGTGAGGCSCRTSGNESRASSALLLLLAAGIVLAWRRRRTAPTAGCSNVAARRSPERARPVEGQPRRNRSSPSGDSAEHG